MVDQAPIFTRNQYVREHLVSHEDYYAQFVTAETLLTVENRFGIELLSEALAEDEHLNNISMRQWDAISIREHEPLRFSSIAPRAGSFHAVIAFNRAATTAANEIISRATLICIVKCAARLLVKQHARQRLVIAA